MDFRVTHCLYGACTHERHEKYLGLHGENVFEQNLLWHIAMYVWDPKMSPNDGDDFELFQDLVFESRFGRLHIYFYDKYLFDSYYAFNPDFVTSVFSRYLLYLEKASPLFANDAFDYLCKKNDSKLILSMLNKMSFDIKIRFVKHTEKYPAVLQAVPKLKLYNLFS